MTEVVDTPRSGVAIDPEQIQTGADFARALTELRLRAGRSIRDVARATEIPSATLGGYFSGRHLPPATQPQLVEEVLTELGVVDPDQRDAWREALLRARRAQHPKPSPGSSRRPSDGLATPSPYRGLEPFSEQDAGRFFGREAVIEQLAGEVSALAASPDVDRLLVLVGPSGSGKSSVLRAGLVPRLRARTDQPWAVHVLVPGTDPIGALATARAEIADAPRALLVIDQCEEIFSPEIDAGRRRAFLQQIAELTSDPADAADADRTADAAADRPASTATVVVAGLRADFYGQAASEPELLPALQDSQILLGAMTTDELRQAVARPAESVGVTVDPELVELLLRDLTPRGWSAGGRPTSDPDLDTDAERERAAAPSARPTSGGYDAGALPLVSHALLATWERHCGDRLTVADYLATGGIGGAVQQTAEHVVAGLDEPGQAAAQWLFTQLVIVDDEGVMTRRRVRHDDLHHPDPATDLALDAAIEAFVSGRLITAGDSTLEISHEALLTAWPRLHDWVLSDLDTARLQRRIADSASAWRERDHDPAALLRGAPLADAQALADRPLTSHRTLTAAEQEYVAASVAQVEGERTAARRRANGLRAVVVVMTVLALVATLSAVSALRARNDAQRQEALATQSRDEARSRQLAIAADDLRDDDPALAAQLALAAYRTSDTLQARSSLLSSTGSPTPTRIVGPVGEMHATASPDGTLLAISGKDGVTRLWQRDSDGTEFVPAGELPVAGEPTSIYASAFSPDGRLLALGTALGAVVLWDLSNPAAPAQITSLEGIEGSVQAVAFSADGGQLAVGTSEPSVKRWAIDGTGEPTQLGAITDELAGIVKSVAWSPTSDTLATGTADGTIRLWSAPASGEADLLSATSVGAATNFVHSVAFSPDGTLLASGEKNRVARIWDVTDPAAPTEHPTRIEDFASWVNTVAFSPDGQALAAGSSDGTVRVVSVQTGQPLMTLPNPASITGVEFVGPGSQLLTSEVDGVARVWPVPGPLQTGFGDSVWNLASDSSGAARTVAPGAVDGALHVFDQHSEGVFPEARRLVPPEEAGRADGAAAMSADGRWLAAGTSLGNAAVWQRDPETGSTELAGVVRVSDQLVEGVAFTADATRMSAVADDGSVGVWTLADGQEPAEFERLAVPGLPLGTTFSPDGSVLAVGTTGAQIHLWRLSEGAGQAEELPALTGFDNYVYGLSFDPSGRYLAGGSTDRTVRLWDVTDPAAATAVGEPLRGAGDTIYALSWSTDGQLLAGASKDGHVWLWGMADPAAPALRAALSSDGTGLYAASIQPDGRRVSAGGTGRAVSTWQVDTHDVAAEVCARTGTGMTQEEWEQVAPGLAYEPPCPVS